MALSDIKEIIEQDLGVGSVSLARINRAAKELFTNYELLDAQRECTLDKGLDELVALPWFIDKIVAIRPNTDFDKSKLIHRVNKYRTGNWTLTLDLEDTGRNPLHTNITNAANLVLTIPKPETAAFSVTVTGGNNLSSSLSETVTFAVGETSKKTVNRYKDVFCIAQEKHKYDLTVSDIDDQELAIIPNHLTEAQYRIIRVNDPTGRFTYNYKYVDILYKPHYRPFVNDGDQFMCGDRYDRAIVFKYISDMYLVSDPKKSIVALQACEAQILQVRKTDQPSLATFEVVPEKLPYSQRHDCYGTIN